MRLVPSSPWTRRAPRRGLDDFTVEDRGVARAPITLRLTLDKRGGVTDNRFPVHGYDALVRLPVSFTEPILTTVRVRSLT
jgi:hypothetical protein